jgi:hypothetical protein
MNQEGFTMVHDWMVEKLGIKAALVYGVVWRYCQMREGVCYASQTTLAAKVGMCRQTLNGCLRDLQALDLVEDLTPDASGGTHRYVALAPHGVNISEQ